MCLDSRHNPPPFKKKRTRPQNNKTNVQSPYWLNPDHPHKTTAKQHLTHPLAWCSRRTPTFRFVAIALANSVELASDAATSICVKISHVFNLIHGDMPTIESLMTAIPWSKWSPLCSRMTCTVDRCAKNQSCNTEEHLFVHLSVSMSWSGYYDPLKLLRRNLMLLKQSRFQDQTSHWRKLQTKGFHSVCTPLAQLPMTSQGGASLSRKVRINKDSAA